MLFNSIEYLIFFPTVCVLYFILRTFFKDNVKRNLCARILLLAASLFFYASWNIAYLALILFSVIVTFFSGILMERYRERKNIVLFGSLFLNLAVLFFFKYYNFFVDTITLLTEGGGGKASTTSTFSFQSASHSTRSKHLGILWMCGEETSRLKKAF